jgi:hypothetical protein
MTLDNQAKRWFKEQWPTTTQTWSPGRSKIWWLRAQPPPKGKIRWPRLTVPGSNIFHSQPDGLWITLGIERGDTTTLATYADCVAIEACGTTQNLSDKRSRYAARTAALVIDLRDKWLNQEIVLRGRGGTYRSRRDVLGGQLPDAASILLPVRHLRVLYALPAGGNSLFEKARASYVLEAHEYICPFQMLGQWNGPDFQKFLKQMAPFRHLAR